MSNKSGTSVINTPSGGGAQQGLGEKFSPDLFTGTGNFSVPIALPLGRNGFQPELTLSYSTGNGNSSFGLGWGISIPGVMRKIAKGVPRYDDERDTFILSGAEDLIPIEKLPGGITQYRPRTEGLFARIYRHLDGQNDYWKVMTKDGLTSWYATPGKKGQDDAVVADPDDSNKVFQWKLTKTQDPFGNVIIYSYAKENLTDTYHRWEQSYLSNIQYMDYGDKANPKFLMKVVLEYEERPDPFSEYKMGFETRINKRCKSIKTYVQHNPDTQLPIHTRTYHFQYLDELAPAAELPLNGVSLLSRVEVEGHDGPLSEKLPPLDFRYTKYQPGKQKFTPLKGRGTPTLSLGTPTYELASLFGNGLPDIVEINGTIRYWRNLGNGEYDMPRLMKEGPGGLNLGDAGVQLIDADGDGRVDLMVHRPNISGYFPSRFGASWDQKSFQKYKYAPSFNLQDPNVKLVDLDGDGITDAIRSGSSFECFFNDQYEGWNATKRVPRQRLERFPDVNFADPRIKWADMTGDGLQSILHVSSGKVQYWPAMGYGNFGKPVVMRNCPRFPQNHDPRRILIGDVDGDGIADLVYVDFNKVTVWINKSGNGWSDPVEITGTPAVADPDGIRLEDLYGIGTAGILWTTDLPAKGGANMYFLDLTGGTKPYLLHEMENNMGSLTRVKYESSVVHYLRDQQKPATRWKTHLPFPVQVVSRVEVLDQISNGKLATEYLYHHGYWDGGEREFRGFARVDQRDTETFADFNSKGLHPDASPNQVTFEHYTPPIETRNWFHLGPVGDEFGDWYELDLSHEHWQEDPQVLERPDEVKKLLKSLPRRAKRDAIRCWRGSMLRSELYALDSNAPGLRPYTVTESQTSIRLEHAHAATLPGRQGKAPAKGTSGYIFFSFGFGSRTTQWERGNDPMTQLSFTGDFDTYGQPRRQMAIAVPRGISDLNPGGRKKYTERDNDAPEPYLITVSETKFIYKDTADRFMIDRSARATSYEYKNDGKDDAFTVRDRLLAATLPIQADTLEFSIIGQSINYYDGNAFTGLSFGNIGDYGALVRSETLILTEEIIRQAYGTKPLTLQSSPSWTSEYPAGFQSQFTDNAGYVLHTVGETDYATGYFSVTQKSKLDFHVDPNTARGLTLASRDPFDNETEIVYDSYKMLPVTVTQKQSTGLDLIMQANYDYRVMQAKLITDPNGNRSAFGFTPLGLMERSAVMGKTTETLGDDLQNAPGSLLRYNFMEFYQHRRPIWVETTKREYHIHDTDIPIGADANATITMREYTDGFGRLLQSRAQAEDVIFGDPTFGDSGLPADQGTNGDAIGVQRGANTAMNVIVSGWTVYDNKGRSVEKYEPFFSKGFVYSPVLESQKGQKARMYYDPRGQVVKTLNPDDSEQQVIFGVPRLLETPNDVIPTPWESYTYDANDLAGITHPTESQSYISHWYTPKSVLLDPMGRQVKTVDRLGNGEEVVMRYSFDIRGNLMDVTDALNRIVFRHVYDLKPKQGEDDPGANVLKTVHIDSGTKTAIFDAAMRPTELRDAKGSVILNAYDELNRPVKVWARDVTGEDTTLRQKTVYGDSSTSGLANPDDTNHIGQGYLQYDEAGLQTAITYDFKGNLLSKKREVIADSEIIDVFAGPPIDWAVQPYRVDWDNSIALDGEFTTDMEYDSMNRIKKMVYPEDMDSERKELRPSYNRAGSLTRVQLDSDSYVEHISYNAKGQRLLIAFGNGMMTRYAYDSETFRLKRMRSEKYDQTSAFTFEHDGGAQYDVAYEYDLAGNIVQMKHRETGCGIGGTNSLDRNFKYDPLYRLLEATGRENSPTSWFPGWEDAYRSTDNSITTAYRQRYAYDKMGNIQSLQHIGNNNFTRNFGYSANHNKLNSITVGSDTYSFDYDVNGNLIQENSNRHFGWDYADRMRVFIDQAGTAEPTKYTHYLYNAAGDRVKKITRKSSTLYEVTVYIDGIFEYIYKYDGTDKDEEQNALHVMDDKSRIAMVRVGYDDGTPAVKYVLDDHLGNSSVIIDGDGLFYNREEYYPFGETSFGSFAKKRYHFVGKERDNESGLYYYGARYYAAWCCRFVSTDPLFRDYPFYTPYQYAGNKPINFIDLDGLEESKPKRDLEDVNYANPGDGVIVVPMGGKGSEGRKGLKTRAKSDIVNATEVSSATGSNVALGGDDSPPPIKNDPSSLIGQSFVLNLEYAGDNEEYQLIDVNMEELRKLDVLKVLFIQYPDVQLDIHGTSNTVSDKDPLTLAEERALIIKDLILLKFSSEIRNPNNISTSGEAVPLYDTSGEKIPPSVTITITGLGKSYDIGQESVTSDNLKCPPIGQPASKKEVKNKTE